MLSKNSTRNARVATHAFHLAIPVCPIVIPIVCAGGFVGYKTCASDA
jgi:hypothetical protein